VKHYWRWKKHGSPDIVRAERSHCRNGHVIGPDNGFIRPSDGLRRCRECRRAADRRRYLKHHDRLLEDKARRYAEDSAFRERAIARVIDRYNTDPEFRIKHIERANVRHRIITAKAKAYDRIMAELGAAAS